jgi:hypothetical protein
MDKSVAKTVARMLNAEVIGGKKGDRWRDDIWTMKYLSGFKWEMLGEQVGASQTALVYSALRPLYGDRPKQSGTHRLAPRASPTYAVLMTPAYERQAHQSRLRNEITRSKAEQGEYLRNVFPSPPFAVFFADADAASEAPGSADPDPSTAAFLARRLSSTRASSTLRRYSPCSALDRVISLRSRD